MKRSVVVCVPVPMVVLAVAVAAGLASSSSSPAWAAAAAAPAGAPGAPGAPGAGPKGKGGGGKAGALSPAEKAAAARIAAGGIAAHVRFLADDLLEGRAPGSRGSQLAVKYIAAQMEAAGLEPGGEVGTYLQKVPMVGLKPDLPKAVTIKAAGGKRLDLALPTEMVVLAGAQAKEAKIADAEVVFCGYGIVAPEFQWDDYKDVDVKGKVVLIMNNDPENDPALFAGKTRLWYGRWDYKYEQAAKKGAAGAIIIHTTPSAGYGWNVVESSNTGEKFELPTTGEPRLVARLWATEDASRRLAALGGQDLDALRAAAETRAFRPVALGAKLSVAFKVALRTFDSANVVGVLPGADAKLKSEAVVFTAHHDHLGVGTAKNGDAIYNGAVDNASGTAALLAIARAAALAERPKRTQIFVAVTAEEQGLLGSAWYCQHPTIPAGRIAANLNMDSMNKSGRTSDVGFTGLGKSSLDDVVLAVAKAQGRSVHGDPFPEKGGFYRSDQFNFARVGVPAIYLRGGPTFVGRPPEWGKQQSDLFEKMHYHQPSDEYDDTWDLSGAVEDAQLYLVAGLRIANDAKLPAWKPGDEFEATRKKAIADAAAGRR